MSFGARKMHLYFTAYSNFQTSVSGNHPVVVLGHNFFFFFLAQIGLPELIREATAEMLQTAV